MEFNCENCGVKCEERHKLTYYNGQTETGWLCAECFEKEEKVES